MTFHLFITGLSPDLSGHGQKISSRIKGTCSKQLFKKQDQKDSLSYWSGKTHVDKSQNHGDPFGAMLHLSASLRSANSDNDEYLKSISSPRHKPAASSSSNLFTKKLVIIEGQSSYEVIDVDDFETSVDKGRKNTRMKPKDGGISEPSTFGEKVGNITKLPSLPDETNDISDSWTKESLSKSFVSSF